MNAALWAELLKLRRSRVSWLVVAGFLLPVLMSAFFVATAGEEGLFGGKAVAMGITPDWPGYFTALAQIDASGGLVLFGILISWVFGREFSDRTALDLLAVPTSRSAVVVAKFAVVLAWSVLTGLVQLGGALLACAALGLWSPALPWSYVGDLVILIGLEIVLAVPIGLAASMGRGYLAGVAAAVVLVPCAVVCAAAGLGAWFPWSVPAAASGMFGDVHAGPVSYALVGLTAAAGMALTVSWWKAADHD